MYKKKGCGWHCEVEVSKIFRLSRCWACWHQRGVALCRDLEEKKQGLCDDGLLIGVVA